MNLVVPVLPTEAMIAAGEKSTRHATHLSARQRLVKRYAAMVAAAPPTPEGSPREIHNTEAPRLVAELWRLSGGEVARLNVLVETILMGAAMLNFPDDRRRQALIVQEISNGAQDRIVDLPSGAAADG